MRRQYENKNIRKFFRKPDINVGFIIFVVIFIYLIISLIMYFTSEKTTIYEVNAGSLSQNDIYTGVIIRDEKVINSDYSGSINYFLKSTERGGKDSIVYTVDETGRVAELINQSIKSSIPEDNLTQVRDIISNFTINYSDTDFNQVYSVKDRIDSKIYELQSQSIIGNLEQYINDTDDSEFFHKVYPDETGIISYVIDGYETLEEADINSEIFNRDEYESSNLQLNTLVNTGNPAYKLIDSDIWYIYIPLSESDAEAFKNTASINISFVNTDISCNAGFSIIHSANEYYGKLKVSKYLINFINDRYVSVKLLQKSKTGLKIPVSSVVRKNFYTIPLEYLNGTNTFVRKYYTADGQLKTESVEADLYGSDEKYYYVSTNDFSSGDMIMKADSDDVYIVGTIEELTGVYCVNKGYSVFRKIEIIDSGKEYCIVKRNTKYGLSLYDHIVLNYKSVKENQLIN